MLADVDANLCGQVAAGLGLRAPKGSPPEQVDVSPALSQITDVPGPIDGRKIGVIADEKSDLAGIEKLRRTLSNLGAELLVIAPIGGTLGRGADSLPVDRTLLDLPLHRVRRRRRCRGCSKSTGDIKLIVLLQEAFRHCKAVGAWGTGSAVLDDVGISLDGPGVVTGRTVAKAFTDQLVAAIGLHRAWARADDRHGLGPCLGRDARTSSSCTPLGHPSNPRGPAAHLRVWSVRIRPPARCWRHRSLWESPCMQGCTSNGAWTANPTI